MVPGAGGRYPEAGVHSGAIARGGNVPSRNAGACLSAAPTVTKTQPSRVDALTAMSWYWSVLFHGLVLVVLPRILASKSSASSTATSDRPRAVSLQTSLRRTDLGS